MKTLKLNKVFTKQERSKEIDELRAQAEEALVAAYTVKNIAGEMRIVKRRPSKVSQTSPEELKQIRDYLYD